MMRRQYVDALWVGWSSYAERPGQLYRWQRNVGGKQTAEDCAAVARAKSTTRTYGKLWFRQSVCHALGDVGNKE